jgi:hypothetical protein
MSKSLEDWRSREAVIDELIVSKHWLRHQADEWLRTAINTGKLLPRTRLIQTPLIEAPWIPIDGAKIRLTPIDDYSGQPLEIVEINLTEVFQVLEGAPVAPTPLMATGLPGPAAQRQGSNFT